MCGIAGIFNYANNACLNRNDLSNMRDYMHSRGPNAYGIWVAPDAKLGLAHRRLSIIDLSNTADQPMFFDNNRYVIVFNGEIYNYLELQAKLKLQGVTLQTNSDTEVILALYKQQGYACLQELRGMFAFALWDQHKQELFLARDHFGIKPVYYYHDGRAFAFASQVKALLQLNALDTTPDPAGNIGLFLWGHIPEPFTLYQNIRALPAGSYITLNSKHGLKIFPYYKLRRDIIACERAAHNSHNLKKALTEVEEQLVDSIKHHFIADVPVGIFLSSGLDSSLVLSRARQVQTNIKTFTLGFAEYKNTISDETVLANTLATEYQTQHITYWLADNEAINAYDHIMQAMDQPSIDGINTYFISKMAAASGIKVAISGLGGDELFGGYNNFAIIPQINKIARLAYLLRLFPSELGQNFLRYLLKRKNSPAKYGHLLDYGRSIAGSYLLRRGLIMPKQLYQLFDREFVELGLTTLDTFNQLERSIRHISHPKLQIMALEMQWYMRNQLLRDTDWAGMAHSVEIRVPFVDIKFVKTVLRQQALYTLHKQQIFKRLGKLPPAVYARKKTGFNVPLRSKFLSFSSSLNSHNNEQGAEIYKWLLFLGKTFCVTR